jgi:hypothetical protein
MEDLNNVPSTGTFGNSINLVNQNFGLVKDAIKGLEGRTIRSKGLFPTQAALTAAYPSPKVGDYAYVGSGLPATIYDCLVEGTWHNTGQTGGSETIDLGAYSTTAQMNTAIDNGLQGQVGYAVCNSNGSDRKDVVVNGFKLLASGGALHIKMTNANTAANATMNISPTSTIVAANTKPLFYNGAQASQTNTWAANEIISVYYDGTNYQATNSQGGGGKANKIKYDNSQSGLASENVQDALDEVGAEMFINGDSLSMGNPINYVISTSSWVWTAQQSKHYLVKVSAGDKIKVTANSNTTAVCVWLTSNAAPSNNSPAPVVSQSSTIIQANESAIITAPQTAEYLYLMGVHSSVEHKPSSVIKIDSLKNVVEELDENAFGNHADYSNIPITWSLGYVQASNGTIKTATTGSYYYSQLIPVDENTICKIKTGGSQNVFTVAMYTSDNTTTADLTKSILGTAAEQNLEFVVPDGIAYIRITNNITTAAQPEAMKAFVAADYVLNKLKEHESKIQELSELTDSLEDRMPSLEQEGSTTRYTFTDAESGYYRDTDHAVIDSQYWYHKSIPFDGGENAKLYWTSSSGTTAASCFFKIGNTYQRFGQDSGGSTTNPVPITVDIPAGTTEILISVNSLVKDTAYAEITIPAYIPEDAVSERMVKELLKKELLSTGLNLKKRRASVSFIFDDGVANDAQIKAIFDNHSKKCGFAVFSPIASRYKTYYDEGFELLAHASSPISNPTEASERAQMKTAYDNVVALVGECHGWVTPSSALADQFKPLVYDYYEYGYTVYKGNIATPSESGMTKDLKTYALWRSSVESITLAEQKAIIDYAVANNLMVCFYGHAYNLNTGGNLTTENLGSLLDYCDTVGIDVMLPYESVSNFFAFRHNEDL